VQYALRPAANDDKLFQDAPPKEGGWQGLANLLEALTPKVDTSIPLTPSQITGRISAMLNEGQNEAALAVIEKRNAQLQRQGTAGTDVQLMFLNGRALAALGRDNEAIDIYRNMTTLFPELPEPWNNLAALYVKQGKLDMARDALNMALASDPNYATARSNLGDVELLLARQSFQDAARLGINDAGSKAAKAEAILK
jgi:tetratricopeptide (TPR) repeat protein